MLLRSLPQLASASGAFRQWWDAKWGQENCIVLDKEAKGIVATGPPARLREESTIPFVHHFFTRSSPGAPATEGR
jgi:hypothetical protein